MKYIKFVIIQFILISCIMSINFYIEEYHSTPFTFERIYFGILQVPFIILIIKLYGRFKFRTQRIKILLTMFSGITSIFIIGIIFGKVIFN
jgi:hypothetical protein